MVTNTKTVEEQRLTALEDVEKLLHDIEHDVDGRISRVRQNIAIAEENLLDDGEYNYCVRLALHQMSRIVMDNEAIPSERTERINTLSETLAEKAALPPQDEITR